MKTCVRTTRLFDAKMGDFGHTEELRGVFPQLLSQKCSKLRTVPCAFFLAAGQNHSRPDNSLLGFRPLLRDEI